MYVDGVHFFDGDEDYMTNKQFESRIVVLKRCDLPKTKSILSLNSFDGRDSFISFQNYHFIDILPTDQRNLPATYEKIRLSRHESQELAALRQSPSSYQPELHTVQSMTLLGRHTSFWNSTTDILYITFIQLRDSSQWVYDKIEHELSTLYPEIDRDGQKYLRWALCYSLDFCDLVLFSRGIPLSELNDFLWKMTISNAPEFFEIQDTFTICVFHRSFLQKAFSEIEKGNCIEWNDTMALTCKVGIQHPQSPIRIKNALDHIGIDWKSYKLTGRYDLLLESPKISGTQALQFLYEIDKLTTGTSMHTLANFEVTLMTPMPEEMYANQTIPDYCNAFDESMSKRMVEIYRNYQLSKVAEIGFIDDYVYETMHSLQELLRNGFAEEFVLSVFPSFEAYLSVANDLCEYLRITTDPKYEINVKSEIAQFDELTSSFFSAVNTLASCTMHNERQFVQAPSFNAAYFEIPPKLLVFYNSIVKEIQSKLHTKNDDNYQFLIVPDYRHNINVLPFESVEGVMQRKHTAIIYLSEKYFYDPGKAILLLGHEVGHYIGNRYREERAKEIFSALGSALCYVYFPVILSPNDTSRICRITGEAIGKHLFEEYRLTRPNPAKTFFFDDIKTYALSSFVNSLPSFEINEYTSEIAVHLGNLLYAYAKKYPEYISTYQAILQSIDQCNVTSYYSGKSIFDDDYRFGCNTLARYILNELVSAFNPALDITGNNYKNYFKACESIVQSFSEAFADFQMLRISGKWFRIKKYVELLLEEEESIDRSIRFHVMRHLCDMLNIPSLDFNLYQNHFRYPNTYCTIIEQLVMRYLSHCDYQLHELDNISEFFDNSPNLYSQAKTICQYVRQYKSQISSDIRA